MSRIKHVNKILKSKNIKIRDFVVNHEYSGDKIFIITNGFIAGVSAMQKTWFDKLEKWEPEEDEYCWFFDETSQQSARLAKFSRIAHGKGRKGQYKDKQGNYWLKCEPFINKLPTFL